MDSNIKSLPLIKPLVGLLESRKALVMLMLNGALIGLYLSGKLQWSQIEQVVTWVNTAWLGAHAFETATEKRSNAVALASLINGDEQRATLERLAEARLGILQSSAPSQKDPIQ